MSKLTRALSVQQDFARLSHFHRTLLRLDSTAKGIAEQFYCQAMQQPTPNSRSLTQWIDKQRSIFKRIEQEAQEALPSLNHSHASMQTALCLESFQWQQRFRHYAIACAGEALGAAKCLQAAFLERYERTLAKAERFSSEQVDALRKAYQALGISEVKVDFIKGGLSVLQVHFI